MKIIIVGGGKVGRRLARKLSEEGNDISVIDSNPDVTSKIDSEMDVFCVEGSGADYQNQKEVGANHADLLIAATAHDEVNMLCCLIAHKLGTRHTIARIRDPLYNAQLDFLKDDLGLSMVINPDLAAAEEIARLLRIPSAMNVEVFARGRVELVEMHVEANNPLIGFSLMDIYSKHRIKVLICAAVRGSDVIIPRGDFVIHPGDRLYITASSEQMAKFLRAISPDKRKKVRTAMICGGGRIAFYLTKLLERSGIQVKIFESNPERAAELSNELKHALVMNSDITDHDLLIEEGLNETDAFVALTGIDEMNIISGLFAKRQSQGKVVIKVNNENLIDVMPADMLGSIVSPKQITANRITAFVRAMSCSPEESNVETVYELVGGRIEALEFNAKGNLKLFGVPLKKLSSHLHKELLIACIVRGGKTIIPGGDDFIQAGDSVVIVTKKKKFNDLADILTSEID